jgi:superfamily II DNA or RNA helicase
MIMQKAIKQSKLNLSPSLASDKSSYESLSIALSSTGHLSLYADTENQETISVVLADKIRSFFIINEAIGLFRLGLININEPLPASIAFWQKFSQLFIAEICKLSGLNDEKNYKLLSIALPEQEIKELMNQAPFMRGAEHLNQDSINILWQALHQALAEELVSFNGNLETYLAAYHAVWNTVGRVCFHLAENKANPDQPFAFLATYTTRLSSAARAQHVPLGRALEEYADAQKKSLLLALLLPVSRSAEKSMFLKNLVDTGEIFQPLAWTAYDAHQFLKDIPHFEAAGVMVRVPNWWNPKKPPRPSVSVAIGDKNVSAVGLNALLDFNMHFALPDGERMTSQEFKALLANQEQLVQIKGQWVEVDTDKLNQVLAHWKLVERQVKHNGLSFSEGLRLLAGISHQAESSISSAEVAEWSKVIEGAWLHESLTRLRQPETHEKIVKTILKKHLQAELRPYQAHGVQWLWWLYNMRLGGCLADDMGLGKTIQILSLLLLIKYQPQTSRIQQPHLLVLPASLLGNWQAEINRFAPSLRILIAHSSVAQKDKSNNQDSSLLAETDIVITTYATIHRLPWINEIAWDMVILDEAQAIKNPSSKQSQAIKKVKSNIRFVLTGTPIENRLLDLWSLFDFVAPGLLGSSKVFANYSKQKSAQENNANQSHFYAAIRQLVSPYILRRLKSDKKIIDDLPDKTEMQTYCTLTKQQVGLYQQAVNELEHKLQESLDGIKRRGLVLSYLLRFKQICNHPSQWLGHGEYDAEISGKFARLKEICEIIAAKQEKVLIFTQFREIIPALDTFLTQVFGQKGLYLHGQTAIKERAKRVEAFQQEQGPPFFILSLKAGGTGLNLTRAAHVVHFDRWWNPAVENQATDRAYRIGQKKNVLVHKFICRGTIEEKIDALITSKKSLADEVISQGGETVLTEISDAELLKIVSLDIHRAMGES